MASADVPTQSRGAAQGEWARSGDALGTDRLARGLLQALAASPPCRLAASFAQRYAERYGRMLTGLPIEATTWRVEARGLEGRVRLAPLPPADTNAANAQTGSRTVFFAAPEPGFVETPVYDRARLAAGTCLLGPAIVEEPAATAVLHPGDRAEVSPYGALIVSRGAAQ